MTHRVAVAEIEKAREAGSPAFSMRKGPEMPVIIGIRRGLPNEAFSLRMSVNLKMTYATENRGVPGSSPGLAIE
jgi:hypothetical protein